MGDERWLYALLAMTFIGVSMGYVAGRIDAKKKVD